MNWKLIISPIRQKIENKVVYLLFILLDFFFVLLQWMFGVSLTKSDQLLSLLLAGGDLPAEIN